MHPHELKPDIKGGNSRTKYRTVSGFSLAARVQNATGHCPGQVGQCRAWQTPAECPAYLLIHLLSVLMVMETRYCLIVLLYDTLHDRLCPNPHLCWYSYWILYDNNNNNIIIMNSGYHVISTPWR